jgi:hypothetical protein
MQCQELNQVLERWSPGELTGDAAQHVQTCANCRALVTDLEAIQQAAAVLGQEDLGLAPPERVWVNLRAALEAEGLIREPIMVDTPARTGVLRGFWTLIPRPALAGAYVAVLLAVGLLFALRNDIFRGKPGDGNDVAQATGVEKQLNAVESNAVQAALPKGDPALAATLRRNLDVVDKFIAVCEKSVREEPQNQLAREYLYGAYQQKAELLSAMIDRGTPGE